MYFITHRPNNSSESTQDAKKKKKNTVAKGKKCKGIKGKSTSSEADHSKCLCGNRTEQEDAGEYDKNDNTIQRTVEGNRTVSYDGFFFFTLPEEFCTRWAELEDSTNQTLPLI